jgi:hypothetical protein
MTSKQESVLFEEQKDLSPQREISLVVPVKPYEEHVVAAGRAWLAHTSVF